MHTDHSSADPEIQAERAYLDTCRAALRRTLHDVRTALDTGAGEGDAVLDKVLNHSLRQLRSRQVTELTADLDGAPLFFGRLDYPSQRRYVGRRGIRDEHGRLLVIDWRAPVARAFYEASRDDPMHVTARRRYGFDDAGVLTAFEDERLDRPATAGGTGGLLAAEIERPRKGPMRDIVATIQPEQMRLVRAPADRTLCVQGAPGTGKTAVGLHRLAYLLYRERERLTKHGGVAVIGPNRSFLTYIRNVLPALGETGVSQTTVDELLLASHAERFPARPALTHHDGPEAARVKGDARMADVAHRHVWSHLRAASEPVKVTYRHRTWWLDADDVNCGLAAVRAKGLDYTATREQLREFLVRRVLEKWEAQRVPRTGGEPRELRRNASISRALRQVLPTIDPLRAVYDLTTSPRALARAADGILSDAEQRALLRTPRPRSPRARRWSSLDLALADEIASLLQRPARTTAHLVIDEAQDLSPMHLRALARRLAGECTVLGDLAQATSPAAVGDWHAVLRHLGRPGGDVTELTRGYRVPAEILDFAARLLPRIAPGLNPPLSFRHAPGSLTVTEVTAEQLPRAVTAWCRAAREDEGSAGVIAADADLPALAAALTDAGVPYRSADSEGDEADGTAARPLSLVPASLAKGLEFDTVLVPEPAHLARAERGLQLLYVALTRAVSRLTVLHSAPLPEPLRTGPAAGAVGWGTR